MTALISHPGGPLNGTVSAPGDKSISHRALIFGGLAVGETRIDGLLRGEDVLATAAAMRALGADVREEGDGCWLVNGVGVGSLLAPDDVLDMGNSGTAARLLIGLVAGHPITATFTGDASLRKRPMGRIIAPLSDMGARFEAREGNRLPLTVIGADAVLPIEYRLPVASAQVKSAVLLAGLNAAGETTVIEPAPTRDHTEHLLRHFGAEVRVEDSPGGRHVTVTGQPELRPADVSVPGDPSSAAFAVVAALLTPGSRLTVCNVGLNPLRAALFDTLRDMGGRIAETDRRELQGEPVADLVVEASELTGIEVPPERAPSMIDEFPILAIAAAAAEGATVMRGIGELRVKESDRIAAMARGLNGLGVKVDEVEDGMTVYGAGGRPPAAAGFTIGTEMDHRIAMSFLVHGIAAQGPVRIDDGAMIDTSFPGFAALMNGLGADIRPTD
jgi:3-phosphoshikimate 1-carboxyvinyltransferase